MDEDEKEQRNDQDNENQSQDNAGNGGGSSSSINKYFGKADKNIKLITSKFKSNIKVPKTQKKIYYTIESSTKNVQNKKDLYQKSKIKFQYACQIEKLQGKLKAKLALNPLDKKNKFSQISFNFKQSANKNAQNVLDIKLNNQPQLITKLKRIRYYMNRSIKHQVDAEVNVNRNLVPKFSFNFDTLQKIDFQNRFKYLKNAHLKGKFTTKVSKNAYDLTKLEFAAKLFSEGQTYKLRTENKFILNWSAKGNHQVKVNYLISDKNKLWTFFSSANTYWWGLKHDQSKFLYSLTQNWKIGAAYNTKGPEFIIQNSKLERPWINSFGFYSSTKNITMIIKNKLDRNRLGKINYELALQSKLLPKSLNDLTFGITLNVNK